MSEIVVTKPILTEYQLTIPAWTGNYVTLDEPISFIWDPRYTTISSAILRMNVTPSESLVWIDAFFNSAKKIALSWDGWEQPDMKSGEADVTSMLYNGKNYVHLKFAQSISWDIGESNAIINIDLIITYVGEAPTVPPPPPPTEGNDSFWEGLQTVLWVGAGLVGVWVVLKFYGEYRKAKGGSRYS